MPDSQEVLYPIVTDETMRKLVKTVDKVSIRSQVVDNLTSTDPTKALSAKQGKILDEKIQGIVDLIYPVGSIYMSRNNTSPTTLFGGTWVQIKDKFLMTYGDTYTQAGGNATVTLQESNMPSHKHSFTPSGTISGGSYSFSGNNASGALNIYLKSGYTAGIGASGVFTGNGVASNSVASASGSASGYSNGATFSMTPSGSISVSTNPSFSGSAGDTGDTGSGTSFSILPPFDVVYAWERTA